MYSEDPRFISHCELIVTAEDLNPSKIEERLGLKPTRMHEKGEVSVSLHSGSLITKPSHLWALASPRLESPNEDIDKHLEYLRARVEPRESAFVALKNDPHTEVMLWVWLETDDGGAGLELTDSQALFWGSICNRIHFSVVQMKRGPKS